MAIDPNTIVWDDAPAQPRGQIRAGNIDLTNRPVVRNPDGSISTVRSISANFDGQEYLIPTVSDDGRILRDDDAIAQFQKTGRNLGVFDTPENATAYAQSLHNDQEKMYDRPDPATITWDDGPDGGSLDIEIVDSAANRAAAQKAVLDDMSAAERFGAGVGKSLVDTAIGNAQAYSSEIAPLLYGIPGLVTRELGRRGVRAQVDQANEERQESDRALTNTGAGLAGNITGTLAQVLGPGIAARGTSLAPALLPTTIRGNALQGAALGLVQPAAGDAERVTNALAGGALGGLGAGAVQAAGAGLRGARNILSRTGLTSTDRAAANVLAREATDPNNLNIEQSAVPGVQRTLGEATRDPGLMALENAMRARNRGAFEAQDIANNVARQDQIQSIAGTGAQMRAAEQARENVVDTTLQQALREGASYQSALQASQAASRRSAQAAADAAVAENQRLTSLGLPASVPVPEVAPTASVSPELANLRQQVKDLAEANAPRGGVKRALDDVLGSLNAAEDSVGSLYLSRKYINDLLEGKLGSDKGYAKTAQAELIGIRDQLDDVLSSRAPSFPQYLDAYKQASGPINRMQVGRQIAKQASTRARDESGVRFLTPDKVFGVMDDLDAVAQKATGFKKARAENILERSDFDKLKAIQDDMQRISQRARSATPGSQTAERLSIGERAAVRGLSSRIPWVGPLFEHFEQASNQRLTERLAFLMANPDEAKRVLAALPKEDASALRTTLNQLALATARSAQPASD